MTDPALTEALARTRESYDRTPYDHAPMVRSHPGRLAAQAVWRGVAAPDAATARVLEIGCATGGNLLPLAATLPQARFLGVDLSPGQIAAAERRRARYGLENIAFRAESFEALGHADGLFDFVICHGVYSWIPEALRESLLAVVKARLAPQGLAMVSFNVLPGFRLLQAVRDCMILHERMNADPARRAERTRALFATLATESAEGRSYGKVWRNEAQLMASGGDAYLAHEIFEESNAPETFADFTARAAKFGLDYLGESTLDSNVATTLAPEGAASLERLAEGDRLRRETYIDIFSGRSFREAVLVHAGRVRDDAPTPAALDALHFLPDLELELAVARDVPGVVRLIGGGAQTIVRSPLAEPTLRRLMERAPASSQLADLSTSDDRAEVGAILVQVVEAGLVEVATTPVACAGEPPELPRLWAIAASDAEDGDFSVTLRHAPFQFAPMQRIVSTLADGSRTRDELLAALVDMGASGKLAVNGPKGPVADREDLRRMLSKPLDNALAGFLRNGLLMA